MEKYNELASRMDTHDANFIKLTATVTSLAESTKKMQANCDHIPDLIDGMKLLVADYNARKKLEKRSEGSSTFLVGDTSDLKLGGDNESEQSTPVTSEYKLINRMTKLEFPSFDGEGFNDWIYKCNQFFEVDETPRGTGVDWEKYLADLREFFIEGIISKPLIELKNLKFSSTIDEYNSEFNALRNQVVVPPDVLLDLYLGGLPNEFLHTIQLIDPKSLNHAMKLAKIQEGAYYALWGLPPPKTTATETTTMYKNTVPNTTYNTTSPNNKYTPFYHHANSPAPNSLPSPKFLPSINTPNQTYNNFRRSATPHSYTRPSYKPSSEDTYEVQEGEENEFEEVAHEGSMDEVTLSIHALLGSGGPNTLQVQGWIKKQAIEMLVDSGGTNNFIDLHIAKRLGLKLSPLKVIEVSVADGFKIPVQYICKEVSWTVQGVKFKSDFLAMPIGGYGVVLGIQWLSTLGDIRCNFKSMFMEFTWNEEVVKLQGYTRMKKDHSYYNLGEGQPLLTSPTKGYNQLWSINLQPNDQPATPPQWSLDLQQLLKTYADVFAEPDLGYTNRTLVFTHFRILGESLDDGLLPLMSDKDAKRLVEYIPRFRELELYIETSVSLVECQMMEQMMSKGKGVVIEEIVDHGVNDVVGKDLDGEARNGGKLPLNSGKLLLLEWHKTSQPEKAGPVYDTDSDNEFPHTFCVEKMVANHTKRLGDEFQFRRLLEEIDQEFMVDDSSEDSLESTDVLDFDDADYDDISDGVTISGKEGDLHTWISDEEVYQIIDVECQDDSYHLVDVPEEPEEISDMFAEIDQALDELDVVVAAEEVTEMYAIFPEPINFSVVLLVVDAEEMFAIEDVDGDDGEQIVCDGAVIPDDLCVEVVGEEGFILVVDGDVITDKVVAKQGDEPDEVLAKNGVGQDGALAEEKFEEQGRSFKRRRLMADKKTKDDAK
ncbi:hypothetical protein CTI12_AA334540 [Artemisia annua]|uniref:Retrotransposon gag domain-containing protein n=1 Tax=Artemisia annua TaxID=35608 RepID=A0A2U1MWF0_ARTAN|nr:hypothetical protein CTI12_AA334540 [Artemisia annua]